MTKEELIELFLPVGICKSLIERGFKGPFLYYWSPCSWEQYELLDKSFSSGVGETLEVLYREGTLTATVPAILYQQAQDWLAKEHGLYAEASLYPIREELFGYRCCRKRDIGVWLPGSKERNIAFQSAILEAIDLIPTEKIQKVKIDLPETSIIKQVEERANKGECVGCGLKLLQSLPHFTGVDNYQHGHYLHHSYCDNKLCSRYGLALHLFTGEEKR